MSKTRIKVKEFAEEIKPMSLNRHARRSLAKRIGIKKIESTFKPKVNKKKK